MGTSFAPFVRLRPTEVGIAFSNARTPPPAVRRTAMTAARAIQPRPPMRRLRRGRLNDMAAGAQGSVSCRDVGEDNGARGLSHFAPGSDYVGSFRARHSGQSHSARRSANV